MLESHLDGLFCFYGDYIMGRPLTQSEAEKKSLERGFELIGEYRGAHSKENVFKCPYCRKDFKANPMPIWRGIVKSCGCIRNKLNTRKKKLTQEEAEERSLSKGFKLKSEYRGRQKKHIFKCKHCGEDFETVYDNITSGNTKSCGCMSKKFYHDSTTLTQEEVENRAKEFGFELLDPYLGNKTPVRFLCGYCNKEFTIKPDKIINGYQKSCGCMQSKWIRARRLIDKEIIEQRCIEKGFDLIDENYIDTMVLTKVACQKCQTIYEYKLSTIFAAHGKYCPKCRNYENGVKTSILALTIHELLDKNREFSEHNVELDCGNVDIFFPAINLIIEIDPAFYHKNRTERDENKHHKILDSGYKLLVIRTGEDIPTKDLLDKHVFDAIFHNKSILTLPDWYTGYTLEEKLEKSRQNKESGV